MVGHGGSSAGSYLADPTSPIPTHCASIVVTSTLRINTSQSVYMENGEKNNSIIQSHSLPLPLMDMKL